MRPSCLLLALWFAAPAASIASDIPLRVAERAGIPRRAASVSGGVPLPKNVYGADQPFALLRADGRQIPCQVSPLVVETDGTLRWVLVDFQDDFEAGAQHEYRLRPAAAARPETALQIDDRDDAVTVDTGAVRFTISRTGAFGLFDEVSVAGRSVVQGGEVSYQQLQGRDAWDDESKWRSAKLVTGPPSSIELHHAGPLRVTIEVSGSFVADPSGAGYTAWITAWAGQARVSVRYVLRNSNPDRYTAIPIGRSTIELRLASAGEVVLGAKEPIRAGQQGWLHQGLYLHHSYRDIAQAVHAGSGDKTLWTGDGPADRPAGWIAQEGRSPLLVLDRLFATNPARRLAIEPNRLVLEGIAARFDGPRDPRAQQDRRIGQPWSSDGFWLYDCSHHTSEYLFDFAPQGDPPALDRLVQAAQSRLWLLCQPEWYSETDALGTGCFGTLEDEKTAYEQWGWKFDAKQLPQAPRVEAGQFVAWEDNHYESEADSVQGLVRMGVRSGDPAWLDQAAAWARYHSDLQSWRTDGWRWKDGAIWFPQGGPQGNMPVREKWNFAWGPDWAERAASPDCRDLWHLAQAKSCYCHYYGSGLADWFCLTGDPDALAAAIDLVETKDEEFRRAKKLEPGKSSIGEIRGFGRGFEVMMRVLQADPQNEWIPELCHLAARTLWESPLLDERGFHCSHIGGGWSGMKAKDLTPKIRQWMDQQGIRVTTEGDSVATLTKGDRTWPVRGFGGTWQHAYVQNGAAQYAEYFDDENLRDFSIAFAEMSARYLLSPKCHQAWYYTYFDVPDLGLVFDPWVFEHADTQDGVGCTHSGYYTRFFPDACAIGYRLTGDRRLLDRARDFWYYGSRREYQTKQYSAGPDQVGKFASHHPPKDDEVLETGRLFYEAVQPRGDAEPPAAVSDLSVTRLDGGRAEIRFTAPADSGGGVVVRYQLKAAELPLAAYPQWDFVRDSGVRRNWWRGFNCQGEPAPSAPGADERFVVDGLPEASPLYFAIRSFDKAQNRSAMSNQVQVDAK